MKNILYCRLAGASDHGVQRFGRQTGQHDARKARRLGVVRRVRGRQDAEQIRRDTYLRQRRHLHVGPARRDRRPLLVDTISLRVQLAERNHIPVGTGRGDGRPESGLQRLCARQGSGDDRRTQRIHHVALRHAAQPGSIFLAILTIR